MPLIQHLAASRVLRKSYEFLSRVPVVGPSLRKLLRFVLPSESLVWALIRSGPGKGLWVHLNPRFEMEYRGLDLTCSDLSALAAGILCLVAVKI